MRLKDLYIWLTEGLRTVKGRNALTFVIFLCIATVFWFLMALNDEVQNYYRMPLKLVGFPENMTIISGEQLSLNVTVKDKGSALIKYSWGREPSLNCRFEDFTKVGNDRLIMTPAQLNSALRGVFGAGAQIIAVRPDSLAFRYTTDPGQPVRVRVDADVHTSPQSVAFGRVTVSTDTVLLYASPGKAQKINELVTAPIVLSGLRDTAVVEAVLQVPAGMKAVPSTIRVTIPVEPLVSKTRRVPVEAVNVPAGSHIVTFPSMVDVTYLLPKSLYNSDSSPVRALVDYAGHQPGDKALRVKVPALPDYYRSVGVAPDKVEYVYEEL